MKYVLITFLVAAAVAVIVEFRRALRTYLKFRGKRLVSCPETHKPAAVRVAAGKNAWRRSKKLRRPAWYGPSSTSGIRGRSVCTATNRSEKSTGTIIRRHYWVPSAELLNGTRSLLKSCRK